MAQADCGMCEALGYLACDRCGNPVFEAMLGSTEDLCGYCLEDTQ